jgi:hypothetical protein
MHPGSRFPGLRAGRARLGASRLITVGIVAVVAMGGPVPSAAAEPSASVPSGEPAASSGLTGSPPPDERNTWCDDPGPGHASWCATLDPELDDAGWCALMGVAPDRCYDAGSARIVLRGGVKRALTVPLRIGARQDPDLGGSISLEYGGHGPAMLLLKLPGSLGEAISSGAGEPPAIDWSVGGVGSGSPTGCTIRSDADAWGTITGTVRCEDVRTDAKKRSRLTIEFRAAPLLAGPLASPVPLATPALPTETDPVCGLLDGTRIAEVTESPGLLLLPAGAGQCVALSPDVEVAALMVSAGATPAPLGDGTTWREAACTPLTIADAALQPLGAACTWPDGRHVVVAAAIDDGPAPATLVLSLAIPGWTAAQPVPPAAMEALTGLLRTAVERHP